MDNFSRKPTGILFISPAGKVKKTYSATRKTFAKGLAMVLAELFFFSQHFLFCCQVAPNMSVASIKGVSFSRCPVLFHSPSPAVEMMNRDPKELKKYQDDPLIYHGNIRASTASTMLKAIKMSDFSRLTMPALILCGNRTRARDAFPFFVWLKRVAS